MATGYADSAQARELDRRMDSYGQPVQQRQDFCHDYDYQAAADLDAEYRKGLAKRINVAMGKMEGVLQCKTN